MNAEAAETLSIALWATNLAPALSGIDAWLTALEARLTEAKAEGAELLVMPEYACAQWLSYAPADLPVDREIAWLAGEAAATLDPLRALSVRHGMGLLAGTMPAIATPRPRDAAAVFVNRAWLFLPDGRAIAQDKLCLTPAEMDPEAWNLATGESLEIILWRGLRIAILICLDAELPGLAARLAGLDLDLVLVPSMTAALAGFHRVFGCARARAIELETIVAAVGAIGHPARLEGRDTNVSGAAVFLPCEALLGHTGVAAALSPTGRCEGPGPLLLAKDLPVKTCRQLRRNAGLPGGAEVWPGAFDAGSIRIDTGAMSAAASLRRAR
jgi:predicted amidohydrolase